MAEPKDPLIAINRVMLGTLDLRPSSDGRPAPKYEQQSPVNLAKAITVGYSHEVLKVTWNATKGPIEKYDDHGVKLVFRPNRASSVTIDEKKFILKEMHFHYPSEHYIDGEQLGAELHIVHQNFDDNSIAVVGILIEKDEKEKEKEKKQEAEEAKEPDDLNVGLFVEALHGAPLNQDFEFSVDPKHWLPDEPLSFYRYEGSLTTPPYTESVTWTVVKEPLKLSAHEFRLLIHEIAISKDNARSIQPINRRYIVHYTDASAAFPTAKSRSKSLASPATKKGSKAKA